MGRHDYAGLTVRGTGPDITAIRLSVLATLLTNRYDSTKQMVFLEIRRSWRGAADCKSVLSGELVRI